MPELPEVETIVTDLNKEILGTQILDVETDWPKVSHNLDFKDLRRRLQNKFIKRVTRRAKFILFWLSEDKVLIMHLKMTGQVLIREKGAPLERFVHLRIHLNNGKEIRLNDLRKFGRVWFIGGKEVVKFPSLIKLGPEPLTKDFTFAIFKNRISAKKMKIKTALLNQEIISGLGNIYCDETLFEARIHPETPASNLTDAELKRLFKVIEKIIAKAVKERGTSDSDYLDAYGKPGNFQNFLKAYRRKGKSCKVCETVMKYIKVNGRGTCFCPKCQPKK